MKAKNYVSQLPDRTTLKKNCKANAVLDWIICGQEFETYHRYFNSNQEEYEGYEAQIGLGFEDEEGMSLHLYFTEKGCIIVPSETETAQNANHKAFEKQIPKEFQSFYKKHFSDKDIPFIIYSLGNDTWEYVENFEINEEINNFDHLLGDAKFYREWAISLFSDDTYLKNNMSLETINNLYQGKILTEDMVLSIVEKIDDWMDLEEALNKIPYRFDF